MKSKLIVLGVTIFLTTSISHAAPNFIKAANIVQINANADANLMRVTIDEDRFVNNVLCGSLNFDLQIDTTSNPSKELLAANLMAAFYSDKQVSLFVEHAECPQQTGTSSVPKIKAAIITP